MAGITFWGRRGHVATVEAQRFLAAHGYAADRVKDIDKDPPTGADLARLAMALGGYRALLDVAVPGPPAPPGGGEASEAAWVAWIADHPGCLRAPLFLTPKGALAGFGERRWRDFLDIGKGRG